MRDPRPPPPHPKVLLFANLTQCAPTTGLLGMMIGGKRRLTVPPKLGYGQKGSGPKGQPGSIPPGATLKFLITLKDRRS